MKKTNSSALAFVLLASICVFPVCAMAEKATKEIQTITKSGTQSSAKGSSDYFTGDVRVDSLFSGKAAAKFSAAYVTFEPGARSAWHIHPTGQHLVVIAGTGYTQEWGGVIEEIKAGDVIWCPPGVKHWHGAAATTAMTHMAITGTVEGKNVEWLEKVTDEQYSKPVKK